MHKHAMILLQCLLLFIVAPAVLAADDQPTWPSKRGLFTVSYDSQLNPIVINQIHSWTLHVRDADGTPVEGAQITVKGGMPAHNHGLATDPVVDEIGGGDYRLQGLRFHMMGHWELTLTIHAEGVTDEAVILLDL